MVTDPCRCAQEVGFRVFILITGTAICRPGGRSLTRKIDLTPARRVRLLDETEAWCQRLVELGDFEVDGIPIGQHFLGRVAEWRQKADPAPDRGTESGRRRKKPRPPAVAAELRAASNPRSPYPTFMLLKSAQRHRQSRLKAAFTELHRADRRLKTGGRNPRAVLEILLRFLCEPAQGVGR